jgi:histidine decarboxylase
MLKKRAKFKALDQLYETFQAASKEFAGYPENLFFDYSKLFRFLNFSINNCGDPFKKGNYYRTNTHKFEREVIQIFAKLFHAPKNNYWGYVTNGGTEGNLYGLYEARELYPDGTVFFPKETHYSILKNGHLLRMPFEQMDALPCGEIDYKDLQNCLSRSRKVPIIVANIGTTMKGAVDDVQRITEILSDLKIKKYYIHCDAAFFGMLLPFMPGIKTQRFDFRTGIDSIAVSGHKMIGRPIPCGVVLTKKTDIKGLGTQIEYIGPTDNTISGSRNGITPLFLWYELKCAQQSDLERIVHDCIEKAKYAVKKFNEKGVKAWRNENSIIVVIPRPSKIMAKKWQLAVNEDISHIITLPQVTRKMVDHLVSDISFDLKKTVPRRS